MNGKTERAEWDWKASQYKGGFYDGFFAWLLIFLFLGYPAFALVSIIIEVLK